MKNRIIAVVLVTALAGSAVLGAALFQRPAAAQEGTLRETALEVFAASGSKVQVSSFLGALAARNKARGPKNSTLSLFLSDPFQMMEYGDRSGVASVVYSLPPGTVLTLLVADSRKLAALGDKAPVLYFLSTLGKAGVKVELLVVDFAGLSYVGEKASLLTFVGNLPKDSVVKLYTTPSELSNTGADSGLQKFLQAVPCRLEVMIDDPLIRTYFAK